MIPIRPDLLAHAILSGSGLNAQSRARRHFAGLARTGVRLHQDQGQDRTPTYGFDTNQFFQPQQPQQPQKTEGTNRFGGKREGADRPPENTQDSQAKQEALNLHLARTERILELGGALLSQMKARNAAMKSGEWFEQGPREQMIEQYARAQIEHAMQDIHTNPDKYPGQDRHWLVPTTANNNEYKAAILNRLLLKGVTPK